MNQNLKRQSDIAQFRRKVKAYWRTHGRHGLPWRKTHDAYKVLVSEVMLQQTQVPRVIEKYEEFLKVFPTVHVLAHASLAEVLKVWNGLGYNRRGKYLHDAAKVIANEFRGSVKDATAQKKLPGIGEYTRAAVRVFAYNEPHTLLETNVRAAFIHHFFEGEEFIHDRDLVPLMEKAAEGQDPREWHWALMDYGSHLKKLHGNPARRSRHYTKQSKFEGSLRQVRGAILRELNERALNEAAIMKKLSRCHLDTGKVDEALASLEQDGLVVRRELWQIA